MTNPVDTPPTGTPLPHDPDDALQASMLKLRADRLRFLGFAPLTLPELAREFWERALLAPDAPAVESAGLMAVEEAADVLLTLLPVNAPFAGLEVKVLDAVLREILSAATAKARTDQQATS